MTADHPIVVTDHHDSVIAIASRRFPNVRFVPPSASAPSDSDAAVALWIAGGSSDERRGWEGWSRRATWVHFTSSGLDQHDLSSFGEAAITNSRYATSESIAEFVLGALLAAVKDQPYVWGRGESTRPQTRALGTLKGATVGLVGLGAIGQAVVARLQGFGSEILAVRRRALTPPAGVSLIDDVRSLAALSDHLVLTAPLTVRTHHIVDAAVLDRARPGLHLVNVARGGLVDHLALGEALRRGIVSRATLDVTEPEPLPEDHPLRGDHRVFLSPHVAASSEHSPQRILRIFLENLDRWQAGEPLLNLVDASAGY